MTFVLAARVRPSLDHSANHSYVSKIFLSREANTLPAQFPQSSESRWPQVGNPRQLEPEWLIQRKPWPEWVPEISFLSFSCIGGAIQGHLTVSLGGTCAEGAGKYGVCLDHVAPKMFSTSSGHVNSGYRSRNQDLLFVPPHPKKHPTTFKYFEWRGMIQGFWIFKIMLEVGRNVRDHFRCLHLG